MRNPPFPKKIKKVLSNHKDKRIDWYFWLRDDERKDEKIIKYLKEENKYTDYWFKKNKVNAHKIFKFYEKSFPKYEENFHTSIDNYKYFSSISKFQEYRKYYRIYRGEKKLILDVNSLAKGNNFYDISGIFPSRNHKFLAYGEDKTGRREFSVVIKDIKTNKNKEINLCSSSGSIIWNKRSDGYFYLKKNKKTLIADSLFFHKLGSKEKEDKLIYKEEDNQFNLNISLSRTRKFLLLEISKTESNEIRYLNLDSDLFDLKCILKRKNKHLYYVDDTPSHF